MEYLVKVTVEDIEEHLERKLTSRELDKLFAENSVIQDDALKRLVDLFCTRKHSIKSGYKEVSNA